MRDNENLPAEHDMPRTFDEHSDLSGYFATRDGKDFAVMTHQELLQERDYVEGVLDFYRDLHEDIDPILKGIVEADLRCVNAALARRNGGDPSNGAAGPITVSLADVEREQVAWLWHHRIPLRKLTIVEGDPGVGKSQLTLAIAAPVTRGLPIFGDQGEREPLNVLIMSAEDGLADTIRPRLEDMGADLDRVFALKGMLDEKGQERAVTLADLNILETAIIKHKAGMVIVDPIIAFTAGADTHRANEVRGILAPLAGLADKHGCAVVAVRHLNKGNGKAIYRGQGTIDFLAACRSAFLVGKNPDEPTEKVLVHIKSNLGPEMSSIRFSIEEGRFLWCGETTMTADQILNEPRDPQEKSERDEAIEFLRETLAGGAVESKTIIRQAKETGIAERTLWRAKKILGVKAAKTRFDGCWTWTLPPQDCQTPPKAAKPATFATVADMAEMADFEEIEEPA